MRRFRIYNETDKPLYLLCSEREDELQAVFEIAPGGYVEPIQAPGPYWRLTHKVTKDTGAGAP